MVFSEEIDLKSLTFEKRQQFSGTRSSSLNHGAYPSAMAHEMERTADTSPQVDNNPSNQMFSATATGKKKPWMEILKQKSKRN